MMQPQSKSAFRSCFRQCTDSGSNHPTGQRHKKFTEILITRVQYCTFGYLGARRKNNRNIPSIMVLNAMGDPDPVDDTRSSFTQTRDPNVGESL